MSLSRSAVQEFYTRNLDRYGSFIAAFQSPRAMRAFLQSSHLLRDRLRVLDAGCGFGMVTFALLKALRERNQDYEAIDAFDLTPAMLVRFRSELDTRGITRVQLQQADVLALEALPPSWANYELIISASMLEYLPKRDLARALAGLRARLAPDGHILVVITEEDAGNQSSHRVVVACRTVYEERTVMRFRRSGLPNPRFPAIPLALLLAEPCKLRCRGRCMSEAARHSMRTSTTRRIFC